MNEFEVLSGRIERQIDKETLIGLSDLTVTSVHQSVGVNSSLGGLNGQKGS